MLEIKNLDVFADNRKILENINLNLEKGKIYALSGLNGSGKSTLANAIMGNRKYRTEGEIIFNKKNISELTADKRARAGIFMSFQNPVEIPGVSIFNFLKNSFNSISAKKFSVLEFKKFLEDKTKELGIDWELVGRNLNENFSGGEKKQLEILQLSVMKPELAILDEIDSGLDEKSRNLILNEIVKMKSDKRTILVITHYGDFLNKINPDKIFRINRGKIENA